jgi:hypothetical protein
MAERGTLIMLSGWMQSGKDTVGELLCDSFGFRRFAFADALKDEVSQLYGIQRGSLDSGPGKAAVHDYVTGETVRELLIRHGELRREEDVHYWVKRLLQAMEEDGAVGNLPLVVVTDWRFAAEYDGVKEHLGPAWKVVTWRVSRWDKPPLADPTEMALDYFPFDILIRNVADKDFLFDTVCQSVYDLSPPNIRIFLTDVDEVLLDWVTAFSDFVTVQGYTVDTRGPLGWNLSRCVTKSGGEPCDELEVTRLVGLFNSSTRFRNLRPCAGAVDAIRRLRIHRFHVVAISSCLDPENADVIRQHRSANLRQIFGTDIQRVVCVPLGASKKQALAAFPPSVWVDDNPRHVQDGRDVGHRAYLMTRPWSVDVKPQCAVRDWRHLLEETRVPDLPV